MNRLILISDKINSLIKVISKIAKWSVLAMLIIGVWNVIGRYIGVIIGYNLSSNRLIESQWYLFDLIFLLGLGWTLQKEGHVRVDVLQNYFNKTTKLKLELFGTLFLLLPFAFGVMAISIEPAINSWIINEASPDPNGLPRYWVKTLIPIGFLLLGTQGIANGIRTWAELKSKKLPAQSVRKGID